MRMLSSFHRALIIAAATTMVLLAPSLAHADWHRHGWHQGGGWHGGSHRSWPGGWGWGGGIVIGPPVIYRPPPVVYYVPPPAYYYAPPPAYSILPGYYRGY